MALVAPTPYLNNEPDLTAILLNQLALFAVSLPILVQLPVVVSVVFVLFVFGRVGWLLMGNRKLAMWQLLLMLAIVGILVFMQVGTFIGLQGGMAFLLLLGALKSFEGHSRRDWQIASLVQIFLLTGAVLFNQSLLTGIWVLVCLVLISTSLAVLNEITPKISLKHSGLAFSLALLPMLVLFIAMPRTESPFWGVPQNPSNQSTTGISDTMKPGSIGDLVQSNTPAFTATFDNNIHPRQQDLYWRVMIMVERGSDGTWHAMKRYMDNAQPNEAQARNAVDYQIVLEDMKGAIPALDYPLGQQPRGIMRELGDVLRVFSRQGVRGISLISAMTDELPHRLHSGELKIYTDTGNHANVRTHALAQQLYQQSGGKTEAFIQAAYQYFAQQGFAYTLKPPVLNEETNVDEFLFQTKQGFCEHYADAFVMLMRSAGVPARVVTGYQGGEWNEQGGFWQIRSKDAHAWAEVWLADRRVWKRVDPTAAVSISRVESGLDNALPQSEITELVSNLSAWSKFTSQSQIYWQRWVVNFDENQQRNLFSWFGFEKVNGVAVFVVLFFGLTIALAPIWLWWKRSRRRDVSPMVDGFALLKRRLLGDDFPNLVALGAVELKTELSASERLTPDVAQVIDDYIRLNYAQAAAPKARAAQAWYRRAKAVSGKHRVKS